MKIPAPEYKPKVGDRFHFEPSFVGEPTIYEVVRVTRKAFFIKDGTRVSLEFMKTMNALDVVLSESK